LFSLALLTGSAGCMAEGIEVAATFAFDASVPVLHPRRELPNYELVDIPATPACERLPLGPGLLAPFDASALTCTQHAHCPVHALCSARIVCSMENGGCEAMVHSTQCTGDQCQSDADCRPGFRCLCEGTGKECLDASCSSDRDCAENQVCRLTWLLRRSPEQPLTCNGDSKHYACTAPLDECNDDQDCPTPGTRCGYDRPRARFACLPCSWRLP
jgi:hypothetical protein